MGCHLLLQEIFPTKGSNPGLLPCRQTLYRLSHRLAKQKTYKRRGFDPWVWKMPLEEAMATYSSILAWSILWASEEIPSNQTEALVARDCESHQTGDRQAGSGFEVGPGQHTTWQGGPPCHTPTHHRPTPSMSEEDPHPPGGAQSSSRPHEVGWKEG